MSHGRHLKPYPDPAKRDDGGAEQTVSANKIAPLHKTEAFANAAEDFAELVANRKKYRTLLLDIAADGQIDHPEWREAAERMREHLDGVLV